MLHMTAIGLFLALLLSNSLTSVSHTVTRTMRSGSAILYMNAAPLWTSGKLKIRFASPDEIGTVASFLADEMYSTGPLPKGQRNELIRLEEKDLRSRYGMRKYTSQLLIAEDDDIGIVGCVGIDNRALDPENKKIVSITTWTEPENIILVLANLAVRSSCRGRGIGQQLVKQCESLAREFGMNRIGLTVETMNTAAKKLYRKQGFKIIFEDTDATCVLPGEFNLKTAPCINLCMVKDLSKKATLGGNGNPFAALFGGIFGK